MTWNACAENSIDVLAKYLVTNDVPIVSGMDITPQKVLPLELKDERLCVDIKQFQNHKIKIKKKPSDELIGFELDLYFEKLPPKKLIEVFYSSDGFKASDSRITTEIKTLKIKQWIKLRFWLPNFRWNGPNSSKADIKFDRSLSLSKLYDEARLSLTEFDGCYLSKFKIIQSRQIPIQKTLSKAYELNPSMFENSTMKTLSLPIILVASICLFLGYRSRLLIKFLVGLIFPFILLVGFFNQQNIPIIENLENSEIQRVHEQLRRAYRALQTSRQTADNLFHNKLQKFRQTADQALLEDLLENKTKLPRFEKSLHTLAAEIGGEILVNGPDGYKFATNPQMHNIERRKKFIDQMFKPYAMLLLNSRKSKRDSGLIDLNKETRKMRAFNVVQEALETSFSTDLRIRDFFYRPEKLTESIIVDFDISEMFQLGLKNRVCWSWFIDDFDRNWLYTGYIDRETLITHLKDSLLMEVKAQNAELKKDNTQLDLSCYLSGYEHEPSVKPQKLFHEKTYEYVAQLSRNADSEVFIPIIENNQLRFYLAKPFGVVEHYVLCLSIPGDHFLERTKDRKNKILYILLLVLASVMALSFLMSLSVTQPFAMLIQAMDRIAKGDLKQELNLPGKNQFSRCASAFNKMLEELREKEFISKFISRMALTNLVDKSEKTRKESVTIMYCGIKNIEYLMETLPKQEAIGLLNECLQIIQNQVVHFGGSVDKFTGNASLCVFENKSITNQPVEAAIAIRDKITEWQHKQKKNSKQTLQVTIGIASGQVILGHVGSDKRKDFTCIGNAVNLAARLGSVKLGDLVHTQVLIAEEVIKEFPEYGRYSLTRHSNVAIKGKQRKQVFYEVD